MLAVPKSVVSQGSAMSATLPIEGAQTQQALVQKLSFLAAELRGTLPALPHPEVWRGPAAEAYARRVDDVREDVRLLVSIVETAAESLGSAR